MLPFHPSSIGCDDDPEVDIRGRCGACGIGGDRLALEHLSAEHWSCGGGDATSDGRWRSRAMESVREEGCFSISPVRSRPYHLTIGRNPTSSSEEISSERL
jgi:hypothetical protein